MRIIAVALVCLLATLFGVIPAGAAAIGGPCTSGISGPKDPDFARAERNPLSGFTFNSEQWQLYDCMPQSAPNATDGFRSVWIGNSTDDGGRSWRGSTHKVMLPHYSRKVNRVGAGRR